MKYTKLKIYLKTSYYSFMCFEQVNYKIYFPKIEYYTNLITHSSIWLVWGEVTDYSLIILNKQNYLGVKMSSVVKPELQMYPGTRVPVFISKDSHAIKAGGNTLFLLLPFFCPPFIYSSVSQLVIT